MLPFADVNIVAVVVSTIAMMGLGFTWYSPKVFGTAWMGLVGMTEETMKNADMQKSMGIGFLATLINAYFVALILAIVGTGTVKEAIVLVTILWLATALPGELHGVAWEQRPMKLLSINAGFTLVGYVVAAVILQSWPA